jgi:hypothetical protein
MSIEVFSEGIADTSASLRIQRVSWSRPRTIPSGAHPQDPNRGVPALRGAIGAKPRGERRFVALHRQYSVVSGQIPYEFDRIRTF